MGVVDANSQQNASSSSEPPSVRVCSATTPEQDATMPLETWVIYTDGACYKSGSGLVCLIIKPNGEQIEKSNWLKFKASNNETEYEAAIFALKTVRGLGD